MKSLTLAAVAALAYGAAARPQPDATITGPPSFVTGYKGFGPFGASLNAEQQSIFDAYTSAHPSGPSSGDWSSIASALSLTQFGPFGTGIPSEFATYTGGGGYGPWGGYGGHGPFGAGHGGFGGGHGGPGPFGGAGFGGWGASNGPFCSTGAWTSGPWTSWWGGDKCPASDWPGWTAGPWASSADWTTWTGCTADVTASSVYTAQTTISGAATQVLSTSYGYKVAQATSGASAASASATGSSGASNVGIAAGAAAAGLIGVVAAVL